MGEEWKALFSCLRELAEQYNKNHKEEGGMVKYMIEENKNSHYVTFSTAVVTPLMYRVHQYVKHLGKLSFLDSMSNLEEHNLRFFVICTHSVAG